MAPRLSAVVIVLVTIAFCCGSADAQDWKETADLLGGYAKWRAAADAQNQVVLRLGQPTNDDQRRELDSVLLLLARVRLRAGDAAGAAEALAKLSPATTNSVSAEVLRIEAAVADGALDDATRLLASLPPDTADTGASQLFCAPSAPMRLYLAGSIALERGDAETAARLLAEAATARPSFADAVVLLANALHASGRSAEALQQLKTLAAATTEVLPHCGVLRDRILFNMANISWDIGARDDAAALYREAIDLAEKREEKFREIVSAERLSMRGKQRAIMLGAQRLPQVNAPAARNNLGHLLLEMAGEDSPDPMLLVEAHRQFLAASRNPDYETPQFAHLGRARADLRGGEPAEAMKALASALWADSSYQNALTLAASLTADERPETAAEAATILLPALREALPKRFIDARYGKLLTAAAARLRDVDTEPARRFSAAYAIHEGNLDDATALLEAARSRYANARWPTALLAQVRAEKGDSAGALALFRTLDTNAIENGTAAPLENIALREALIAYTEVAADQGTKADVTHTENLLASLFDDGPGSTLAYTAPWELTGRIEGKLTTADGGGLPAVRVTVMSEDGHVKTAVTGSDGTFMVAVRPGSYVLTAEQSGMNTLTRDVAVGWDARPLDDLAMELAGIGEAITVAASAPSIAQGADLTTPFSSEQIETWPSLNRSFSELAALEPPSTIATPMSINGASSMRMNTILVDGANTSDTLFTAGPLQEPSLSLARELQFAVAGQQAGDENGVFRLVTKSGSDQLEITADAMSQPEAFREDALPVTVPYERQHDVRQWRATVSGGGPLRRGKLWLFALGEVDDVQGTGGIDGLSSERRNLEAFAKLHASISDRVLPSLTLHRSEERRHGALNDVAGSLFGSETATGRDATHETTSAVLSAYVALTQNLYSNAFVLVHRDESSLRPRFVDGEEVQHRIASSALFATGGVGFINDGRVFRRNSANVNISAYINGHWNHVIRGGGTYDEEEDTLRDRLSGGFTLEHVPGNRTLIRYWGNADDLPVAAVRETFASAPFSLYLKDNLQAGRFIIDAGLRWTRQSIDFPSGAGTSTAVMQPRLNVTMDPSKSGLWKIFATYGRFNQTLGADERVAMGSQRRYIVKPEFEPIFSPVINSQRAYGLLAGIDPNLRGRYEDEMTVGYSHELTNTMSFRITGIRRRLQSDVQDFFCTAALERCIGNPGRGIMSTLRNADGAQVQSPEARRALDAVDVVLNKTDWRMDRVRLSWGLHYVWARRIGNVEEPDLASTRTLGIDPYSRIAFDLAELVPPNGPLARDRRHTARAYGVLSLFKERLIISATTWWRTGEPRARFGYSDLYGRYAYYLTARGAEDRSPSAWDANARIAYEIKLWKKSLQLALTIENARNRQASAIDDQRWNFSETTSALNPQFLQPMERIGPRTVQFGAKFQY